MSMSIKRKRSDVVKRKIRKIWNGATSVLVGLMLLLAALLWGVRLVGLDVFLVQSGSMEPKYHVGSVVYVQPVDTDELKAGDVITYQISPTVRGTHRIVEVVEDGGSRAFRTKGDANEEADLGLVKPSAVVGRVVFSIPYLGYFAAFIQHPPGSYLLISAGAVILLLILLPDLLFPEKNSKQEKTEEETT